MCYIIGPKRKDYQIFALSDDEWGNIAILCEFLKVFYDVTCVFSSSNYLTANLYFRGVCKVQKNFKSTSSSLAKSSNVSDNDYVDSNLHQLNVNRVYLGGDYDEKLELELNSQIDVLDYWSKSSIQYRELSFLARDLLAIPMSTVASESAFSMGKK
ncbi:hypothetical protein Gogos_002271, partial [Gossypium gossypioides]|nr:hypothetical protein [Gossypium gossypioides]